MDLYGVREYLERAKQLLSEFENHAIRYSCLELRFCLEVIAYRQLEQYGETIPESVTREWRADHIIKLLASFSPGSDQGCKISIGSHNSPDSIPEKWISTHEAKAIPWAIFRKHYQKLGSYLHAPKKKADRSKAISKEKLLAIVSDIEHVLSADIILAFQKTINAECECGKTIFIGESEFEDEELVRCRNRSCGLLWRKVTLEDSAQVLQLAKQIIYKCPCGAPMRVAIERVWDRFRCGECSKTYRLNLGFSQVEVL